MGQSVYLDRSQDRGGVERVFGVKLSTWTGARGEWEGNVLLVAVSLLGQVRGPSGKGTGSWCQSRYLDRCEGRAVIELSLGLRLERWKCERAALC